MESKDKTSAKMTLADWAELWQLNEQAKVALMMGNLDQMQMADAMAFHTLSLFILSLNERLSKLDGFKSTTDQSVESGKTFSVGGKEFQIGN